MTSTFKSRTHLFVVPAEGGVARLVPIGEHVTAPNTPIWTPDGKQILFGAAEGEDRDWVCDMHGMKLWASFFVPTVLT